ncbi:uncharacterized protein EV420DRAFT_1486453 [Desarmillaria tabescens]|uniref:Uncharacterized protein n=1 Tax=Armillaria tabescens TaxID=1929756 RepID=A0AA39JBP4_ARMTA|nr:uncharacterized protein EV420DRAFT_1486453 [Desarmillaria tabescens]KAK0439062.1 hypothetical protein EV420DRAFT_1486453 [Desarmillaria tabescens]
MSSVSYGAWYRRSPPASKKASVHRAQYSEELMRWEHDDARSTPVSKKVSARIVLPSTRSGSRAHDRVLVMWSLAWDGAAWVMNDADQSRSHLLLQPPPATILGSWEHRGGTARGLGEELATLRPRENVARDFFPLIPIATDKEYILVGFVERAENT